MDWKNQLLIESYIQPRGLKKKLEKCEAARQPVYIFGSCGFGKTELIHQYFKDRDDYELFSARAAEPKALAEKLFPADGEKKGEAKSRIIVIDDLYGIFGNKLRREWKEFFERCKADEGLWLIVCSRSAKTPYYQNVYGRSGVVTISETDLGLSHAQVEKLFKKHGIELSIETMEETYRRACGNPLWTFLQLSNLKAEPDVKKALRKSKMDGWRLLNECVYSTWPKEMLEPIIKLSILSEFDLGIAEEITGIANVKRLLDKAEELGNFLIKEGEVYRIRESMRLVMVARQYRKRKPVKEPWQTGRTRRTPQEIHKETAMNEVGINEKELEIIKLMALGKTNIEIGEGLGVREVTVKYHNMKIFKKLGVKSRIQVIREAQRRGLI